MYRSRYAKYNVLFCRSNCFRSEFLKELVCRHRLTDLKPLQPVTAELLQKFDLAVGFDALGHAGHTEVMAQINKMTNDKLLSVAVFRLIDQAFVDFSDTQLGQIQHF